LRYEFRAFLIPVATVQNIDVILKENFQAFLICFSQKTENESTQRNENVKDTTEKILYFCPLPINNLKFINEIIYRRRDLDYSV